MARLRVDMVACEGIGQCALVAPGLVGMDRWGYPVVLPAAVADAGPGAGERGEDAAARRAVRACPRHALWLEHHGSRR